MSDTAVNDGADVVVLGPDEVVDGHPCTNISVYAADRGLIAYMLQDIRALLRLWPDEPIAIEPHESIVWWVHGLKRRLVPCDLARVVHGRDLEVVGFFGSRRLAAGPLRARIRPTSWMPS